LGGESLGPLEINLPIQGSLSIERMVCITAGVAGSQGGVRYSGDVRKWVVQHTAYSRVDAT